MFYGGFTMILSAGFAIALVLYLAFMRPWKWTTLTTFFLLLLLLSWVAGTQVMPARPAMAGSYTVPLVLMGGLFVLVLSALMAGDRPSSNREAGKASGNDPGRTDMVSGLAFWTVMISLAVVIAAHYTMTP